MTNLDDKTALAQILEEADRQIRELFGLVEEIQDNFLRELADLRDQREVGIVTPDLRARLASDPALIAGAGVTLADGAVAGVKRMMEWWSVPRGGEHEPHRLQVSFDPQSVSFYDYVDADWYLSALESDRPVVIGPYVDALGTDENVITLAQAIREGDEVIGVSSLDMRADEISTRLSDRLETLGTRAALVNSERRVIASTSVDFLPGSFLGADVETVHHAPLSDWQSVLGG